MKTSELDYELPESLIAQHPAAQRDESRLMVLDRAARSIRIERFSALPGFLNAGDCLVLNDTKVIRARLSAVKASGGKIEIFLLKELAPGEWSALVRPSARVKPGTEVTITGGVRVTVREPLPEGQRRVRFETPNVFEVLEQSGAIPLPPYIRRESPEDADLTRYQTIYARQPGAVAAPTAGLHFTPAVVDALERAGVRRTTLTLHVGYGTFRPIQVDDLAEHRVDGEEFEFTDSAAGLLNETRANGGRVVAVGTTSARVLETQYRDGRFVAGAGETHTYIYPPHRFQGVDVLQTNFHLPKSSLLALVCAFAGTDFVLEAYRRAVKEQFRFYSYGDVMLIL
jgi:S-adenosylmethionine:tRNA ribosyltransferase-isomerase